MMAKLLLGGLAFSLGCGALGERSNCVDAKLQTERAIRPIAAGDIEITELMSDPKGVSDKLGEWVELYAHKDVDLAALGVQSARALQQIAPADCGAMPAESAALLAADESLLSAYGPPVYQVSLALTNSGGAIELRRLDDDLIIDRWAFGSARSGVSLQRHGKIADTEYDGYGNRGTPGIIDLPPPASVD